MAALQYSCLANPHRQRSPAGFSLQGLKELDVTEVTQHALMHQLDILMLKGFPDGSVGKETVHNAGDPGLIPELERSPGEGNGNHSSIAQGILWTEETGGLQSMELQKSWTRLSD